MKLPQLRNVDAVPVEHEGQQYICLIDPTGIVEGQVVLSPQAFFVAAHLADGATIEEIQAAFASQTGGQIFESEDVQRVVDFLDERGLLVSQNFYELKARLEREFTEATVRPAYLAGKSYPADPDELISFLDEQFEGEKGPGKSPPGEPGGDGALSCMVVPHIDFHRGGHVYAHGYAKLRQSQKPEVVFIFGVAHSAEPVPFILTRKHFDTPLGLVETDREIVSRLEKACSWDPYEYELVHRTEHSIEFQALMLAYIYGTSVKIVPVLCSMFCDDPTHADPEELEGVETFLAACREIAEERKGRVLAVASADLAHVGKRFGDSFDIDEDVVQRVRARDEEDLAHVTAVDARAFYKSVMKDMNARKVCGINCIYAALKTVEGFAADGELTSYDYAPDPAGGIVSFASVSFS